jgi:hypothetical protein
MGEILKQEQTVDEPDNRGESEEYMNPRLRISLRHVDFVSPLGAFRAQHDRTDLQLAPNTSEVWADWRKDLERRISRTAVQADAILAEIN